MNRIVLTLLTHSVTRTLWERPNNVVDIPMTFLQRYVFAGRHVYWYAYFHQGFSRLVFQSYQGDGFVIIKGYVHPFMNEKIITSSMAQTKPGTDRSATST